MLRKIRITLAAIVFVAVTMLFLDYTGTIHQWLGWLAKIQFLPAVLALNLVVVVVLVLVTLLFGRVYCSVICPLGIFQDGVSWLSSRRKGKKMRFKYSKEVKWLRYGMLALFIIALIAGVHAFVALLAPYSSYGRIVQNLFAPVYQWINNVLAYFAERRESYAFVTKEVWIRSIPTFVIAAVTFVIVVVLAWKNGRTYCNTICPVGTTLSFFSRFAMFRPVIDASKCKTCHACEKTCKSSCISIQKEAKTIDYSRCVDCFNCIDSCKFGALKYRFAWKKQAAEVAAPETPDAAPKAEDNGRRAFLASSTLALAAVAVKAQDKKLDGGLADVIAKKQPERENPVTPFGSKSIKDFYNHCTACQLCVSVCPNDVLRPSTDLQHLMQPEMSYERGYCRPECTLCSEVCPTGAIIPITPAEKTAYRVGIAQVDRDLCIVEKDGVACGNCSRHCPVGAIRMLRKDPDDMNSPRIPVVDESKCIGCGACENLCPARPISAIKVNGLQDHLNNA